MSLDPTNYILEQFGLGRSEQDIRNELVISGYESAHAGDLIAAVKRDYSSVIAQQNYELSREGKAGSRATLIWGIALIALGTVAILLVMVWGDPLGVWSNPRRLIFVLYGMFGLGILLVMKGTYDLFRGRRGRTQERVK